MNTTITVGLRGTVQMVVTSQDTAIAMRSGDVPVLATPRIVALVEEATCEALRGHIDSRQTSVGTSVEMAHRRPSPLGARVTAHAQVVSVEGPRVVFDVRADHETPAGEVVESIARGRITRVVVDRDSFSG